LDYYEKHPVEKDKLGWYFQYLVDMEFFKEICDDKCKYSDMVSRVVTIFMRNDTLEDIRHQKCLPIMQELIKK